MASAKSRRRLNSASASDILRQQAEQQFAEELEVLKASETKNCPPNWQLSP